MTEKIKILFLAASPMDSNRLRLDEELREIDKRIQMAKARDHFELISHWAVTADDLQQALLRHKPHIVHFSGHGSKTRGIALEDKFGNSQMMGKSQLIDLFKILKDNVCIIVLNACYARCQAVGLAKIIDYTIGVQTAITDRAAILFAATFYQGLAYERTVKDAFDLAQIRLQTEGITRYRLPKLMMRKGVIPSPLVGPDLLPAMLDQSSPRSFLEQTGHPILHNITVTMQRDLILTIAKIIAGIILIIGLYFIGQYIISVREKATIRQHFKEACDQLTNQTPAIRTSAISGLAQLASEPKADFLYKDIIDTLTVFVRNESAKKTDSSVQPVISDNVQDALNVLTQRAPRRQDGRIQGLALSSNLSPINLRGAVLTRQAGMEGAHLEGALLNNANLEEVRFRGVNLQDAVLVYANLRDANLDEANLEGAYLGFADLANANLRTAKGLTRSQLREATNCLQAKLPPDIEAALRALKRPCR